MALLICGTTVPTGAYYAIYNHTDGSCTCYLQADESTYIEPNFQLSEFCPTTTDNPQGTSQNWETYQKLADQLQSARSALASSINITSGFRSNTTDVHHYGLAVDTVCSAKTFVEVAQAYYNAGFVRIEVMKPSGTSYRDTMSVGGHVHVDVFNPNSSEYNAGGAITGAAYPWYAAGLEGGSYTQFATFSELLNYLNAN